MPNYYDPHDEVFLANPWPTFRRMRDEAPAYFVEHLNMWALSRFEDVMHASMDRTHYTATMGTTIDALITEGPKPSAFVFMDPPAHTSRRNLLNPPYGKSSAALLEERFRARTREFMAPHLERGELEIYGFSAKVALYTIADIIGLSYPDITHIRALLDIWFYREPGVKGMTPQGMQAFGELHAFIMGLVRQFRVTLPPPGTHIHTFMTTPMDGQLASDDEVFFTIFSLVITGSDTVALTAAGTIYYLAKHPKQYAEVRADRGLIPHAFAETARYDQPTNVLGRRVTVDHELHGEKIKVGQNVIFLFASANRDEREFPDADQFQISRRPSRTLSFGAGIHACLGQHLARMEGRVILEEIMAAIPEYEVQMDRCKRTFTEFLQGYCDVPITFKPR